MDISELATTNGSIEAWLAFRGTFRVLLKYIPKQSLANIVTKCTTIKWERHQRIEDLDNDKLTVELAEYIKDWEGATDKGEPYPCTEESKIFLLKNSYGFVEFVSDGITDLELLMSNRKEAEKKNSMTTSPDS